MAPLKQGRMGVKEERGNVVWQPNMEYLQRRWLCPPAVLSDGVYVPAGGKKGIA